MAISDYDSELLEVTTIINLFSIAVGTCESTGLDFLA